MGTWASIWRSRLSGATRLGVCLGLLLVARYTCGQGLGTHADLAGQVELARLVDLAAQRLHLSVDYDAAVLKGAMTLRLDGTLSDTELWTLVNRLLAVRG